MLNEVKFIGNLTKDVVVNKTNSQKSVANLDIALNYYKNGEKKTEYVQVIAWDKSAEDAGKYLTKGRQVFVEAKVVVRRRQLEGKNIPIPEFHADKILYLGTANNQNGGSSQGNSQGLNPPGFQPTQSHDPFVEQNGENQSYNPNNDPNYPFIGR